MNRGGAETMLMNIYRNIDRTRFQFDFIISSPSTQDYENEICSLGGQIIRVNTLKGAKGIYNVLKVLKKYGPYRAIHCSTLLNSSFCLISAAIYSKNIIRIVHSHSTRNVLSPTIIQSIYEYIAKKIINKFATIKIACGIEAGHYLFGEKFDSNGIILNNCIDNKIFYPYPKNSSIFNSVVKLQNELNISNQITIGCVARLVELKNHRYLIEIGKQLKQRNVQFKFVLVGDGPLKEYLSQEIMINNLQNNFIFVGVRQDTSIFYNLFDCLVLPSFYEGNPVTLIEAQACGIPCIVSEAITNKMDLGLGLLHRLNLKDINRWCDLITELKGFRITDSTMINNAFCNHGYDLNKNIELLVNIYDN